ncbi:hypothetical protein Acsp01_84900 [Actinoplanes sp. NBRC 101535]|nr:hypothetical protein Acsp01_84900 [Actinoplanes sp. NBRC 101535]
MIDMGTLDGLDPALWDGLLAPDEAVELVAALRKLAEEGDSDHRIGAVLEDRENDYSWVHTCVQSEGYRPAAIPVIGFLARIAAQPSGVGSETALELVDSIVGAALDRPTMSGDELDAMVDGLRAAVDAARPDLLEAHRLGRSAFQLSTPQQLLDDVDSGRLLGGAEEPIWRGTARALMAAPAGLLAVAGGLLVTWEETGLAFRSPDGGAVRHTFDYPGPPDAWPHPAGHDHWGTRMRVVPFADDQGLGVLTSGPVLWRLDGTRWHRIRLTRPGRWPRWWRSRSNGLAVAGDTAFVGYADGTVAAFDTRTGTPAGTVLCRPGEQLLDAGERHLVVVNRRPDGQPRITIVDRSSGRPAGPAFEGHLPPPVHYRMDGQDRWAVVRLSILRRVDPETGADLDPVQIVGENSGLCSYEVDGRTYLAAAVDRQIVRFDAATGEQSGPLLYGHRRAPTAIVAMPVDGRPTLFSADGTAVRRWDAATGTPWPAAVPPS